jgi:Kef-type K+ transport system membrane component KefB
MNVYYVAAIWLGMALLASVISIRIAVPAALVEIVVGALAGNIPAIREHVTQTGVVVFLASVGSLVLTFLAGAEIDPVSLRGHWKASLSIGVASFAPPFLAAFGFCKLVLGWHLHAAEIGGIGLVVAGVFLHDRVLMDRLRSIAFALLTPFFFLRAGTLISAPALITGAGAIAVLLLVKLAAKMIGVWPVAAAFKLPRRERTYTTLLMATGLTFGSIAALFRPHPWPD